MPNYIYQHPETEEYIEVFQLMNDEHVYFGEDGVKWNRVLIAPQLNTESTLDPWNKNDFMNRTSDSKGSYGDLMDRSKEMSEKRAAENGGVDPIKQKYLENYSKQRGGKKHFSELKSSAENKHVKIDL